MHEFDRTTGVENVDNNPVVIDSVAPLPGDIRDILLGLDRKYREAEYRRAEAPNWRLPEDEAKLTKDEIRALLFVGKLEENKGARLGRSMEWRVFPEGLTPRRPAVRRPALVALQALQPGSDVCGRQRRGVPVPAHARRGALQDGRRSQGP